MKITKNWGGGGRSGLDYVILLSEGGGGWVLITEGVKKCQKTDYVICERPLTQTMAFSHLKPKGYELVHLPYDMNCPSVQSKLKDSRCQLSTCLRVFTTLDLAKRHSMLSGHSDLTMTMDDEEPIHAIEENDQAPIVSAGEFLKLPSLNFWTM